MASDAGAAGSRRRSASKASRCSALAGLSGSSAQARWLITSDTAIPESRPGLSASCVDLGRCQTEPRHAAVDLQRRGERTPGMLGRLPPGVDLAKAVQHRLEVVGDRFWLGARRQAVEDVDDGAWAERRPQRHALGKLGDEEVPATLRRQRRRDVRRTEPVGVGLDDGGGRHGAESRLQAAVVVGDGAEVDGQDRAGRCRGDWAGRGCDGGRRHGTPEALAATPHQ